MGLFATSYFTGSLGVGDGTVASKWAVGEDVVEYRSVEEIFGAKTASVTGVDVKGVSGANGSKAEAAAASAN